MSSSLERLVNHDLRLDLLCCLADGPLPAPALAARVGKPEAVVAYHLRLLEGREVVGKGGVGGADALYAATLDKHPPWVAEAVAGHKEGRPQPSSTARVIVGMKCDGCERLLQYRSEVVAVYLVGKPGTLRAMLVPEDTPRSGEAANLRATAKYHTDCYLEARKRDASLPPVG